MANFFDKFDNPQNFFDQFDPPKGDEVRAKAKQQVEKEKAAGFNEMPRFAEGLPFIGGLLDEATGLVQQGLHTLSGGRIGETYEMGLELERERSARADEENPAMATTGKIAAGLTGFAPVAKGIDAALSAGARFITRNPAATVAPVQSLIRPAETVAGNVVKGVTTGAGIGAVEGFTRGEGDFGNRMDAAGDGATVGAVLGGVLPVASAGVSRGYGALADIVTPGITRLRSGPEAAADAILARRIAREGSSPAQKRLDLQEGQQTARLNPNSQAELPETLADTSDAMQRLTGSVYRAGGEAGNLVKRELQSRQRGPDNPYGRGAQQGQQGQRARVLDTVERTLLIKTADNARRTDQKIMVQQARDGNRLYKQAEQASEAFNLDPAIQGMALKAQQYPGPFAAQLQRAINLFRKSGTSGNQPFWVDDVRRFDASKKALDDMIDTAERGGKNNLARELTEFKNDLLGAVHAVDGNGNPTRNLVYKQARDTWGSAAENRKAIELGKNALKEDSEVLVDDYLALTPGQQVLFRIGLMSGTKQAMGRTRPGNNAAQLFEEPRIIEIMNAVIPSSKGKGAVFANRAERFGEIMRREGRMSQTRQAVLGNSMTARNANDDLEFAGDVTRSLWDRMRQAPSLQAMAAEAIGAGMQNFFGLRQDVAEALARRLLESDRTVQNQILRRLQARGGPDVFARFVNQIDQTALQITGATQPALADMNKGDR